MATAVESQKLRQLAFFPERWVRRASHDKFSAQMEEALTRLKNTIATSEGYVSQLPILRSSATHASRLDIAA
jgi:hypothetical protein